MTRANRGNHRDGYQKQATQKRSVCVSLSLCPCKVPEQVIRAEECEEERENEGVECGVAHDPERFNCYY